MKILISLAFVALAVSSVETQTLIKSGDKLQWDQVAPTLAEANSYQYELALDHKTPQEIRMILFGVVCVKGASSTAHVCSSTLPVLPVGTHTLSLTTQKMVSLISAPLSVTAEVTDPRCVFPTGEGSLSIFPTRLLNAGSNAGISFQMGTVGHPVRQITILLDDSLNPAVPVSLVRGENLNNVGLMWFPRPVVAGTYQVIIQAYNDLGCLTTSETDYSVTVK